MLKHLTVSVNAKTIYYSLQQPLHYTNLHTHTTPNSAVHSSVFSCFASIWTLLTVALQNTQGNQGSNNTLGKNAQQTLTHMHCSVAAWAHHKAPLLPAANPCALWTQPPSPESHPSAIWAPPLFSEPHLWVTISIPSSDPRGPSASQLWKLH